MAIIKQEEVKRERYVKKETKLKQSTWSKVVSYAKYAGIKGQAGEKRDFIVEAALEYLFNSDKGFVDYIGEAEALAQESKANVAEVKKGLIDTNPKK